MRGREGKGPQPTDLLVCFPSRAHLSLMPKPICSPARPSSDSSPFHHHHRHPHHQRRRPSLHQLKKSSTRGGGHGSPLMWAKTKHNNNNNSDISEPTSPKVTCAGQIKVKTKTNSCKNWQSVMEEIERMHNNSRKKKKRPAWIEALGFKKEVMQFLTCLRNVRFDFRCFGSIPAVEISSDDDEEDDEDVDDEEDRKSSEASSGAVFSKWFMILQEENLSKEVIGDKERSTAEAAAEREAAAAPPKNALLLMRCRSAPAKSWLEEREEEEERERCEREEEEEEESKGADFCEFAVEIAKENWVQEKILRSRSWKR